MTARTGKQYLEGLRDGRILWLGNASVDVSAHPALAGSLRGMAGCFGWQHEHADDCLVPDPETGRPMNASLIAPRCADDLRRRHVAFESLARYSAGMLFAHELCTRMARATNSEARPEVAAQLGEIRSYAAVTRAAVSAAEQDARDRGNGAFFCDDRPLNALRALVPGWMVRTNDIIRGIGSQNPLATPSLHALRPPKDRSAARAPDAGRERHERARASERAKIFRAAWDFAGSALGSRTELYERFYLSSAPRSFAAAHFLAQAEREWGELPALLKDFGVD